MYVFISFYNWIKKGKLSYILHSLSVKCYFIFDVCGDQLVKIRNSVNTLKLLELILKTFSRKSATGMNPDLGGLSIKKFSKFHKELTEARIQIHHTSKGVAAVRFLISNHFRTRGNIRRPYRGWGDKELHWCSVALFSHESKCCILFWNQGPRVSLTHRIQGVWSPVWSAIWWLWYHLCSVGGGQSTVFDQVQTHLSYFHLLTGFISVLVSFSSSTWQTPTVSKWV